MTNKYRETLIDMPDESLPRNPCKFLRVWRDQSKEAYVDIMEGAIFSEDDDGNLFDLGKVAALLSQELNMGVSKSDISKHRNWQCLGCSKVANRELEIK